VRDASLVVLGGIVGVPWQDLALDPTNLGKGYKTGTQVDWDTVIGAPSSYKDPTDPFMIPSISPRTGKNPASSTATSATGAAMNPINGSERQLDQVGDLQYACIFRLPTPRNCSNGDCDCDDANNPLCRDPQTGTFDPNYQYSAKAYPSLRELEVIRGLGSQGVPTSICAAETTDQTSALYGYRPAVNAMISRLKLSLAAQ
jgi:hypothetical protein